MRTALRATNVAALVLAWLAGAWCFCGTTREAAAADQTCRSRCPMCPPAPVRPATAGRIGWCPIVSPAVPAGAKSAVPAVAVAWVVGPVVPPGTVGEGIGRAVDRPQWRPPPGSLLDLHCSLVG